MNILVLSRYAEKGASSRLRFFDYYPYLKSQGINIATHSLFSDDYLTRLYAGQKSSLFGITKFYLARVRKLLSVRRYDMVWIEKELFPMLPGIAEWLLNVAKVPYVVDYDDAIFHNYDKHKNPVVRTLLSKKIDRIMRGAVCVVAGNEYLAERARLAGAKNILIVPTVIDLERYPYKVRAANDVVTIGWAGTPMTVKFLDIIKDALVELSKKHRIRLLLVGVADYSMPGVDVECRPWSETTEVDNILDMDIGVMPLYDEPWEKGKCGYKLVQYMATGMPVVASPVGVNASIVKPGSNGFHATDTSSWVDALAKLITSQQRRSDFGAQSRAVVEKQFSLQVTGPKIHQAILSTKKVA